MKEIEKEILKELNKDFKLKNKIISTIFCKFTLDIYKKGFERGFDFSKKRR